MFPPTLTHPLAHAHYSSSPAARAFQLAFEAAREPVRFAVLHTFKIWNWELNGAYPPRDALHSVYTRAPGDLRAAVDYIIRWDSVSWLRDSDDLKCHEDSRRAAADSKSIEAAPTIFHTVTAGQLSQRHAQIEDVMLAHQGLSTTLKDHANLIISDATVCANVNLNPGPPIHDASPIKAIPLTPSLGEGPGIVPFLSEI
ncbi:unnamed protein product [Peniophora sp. CBMAI 1063]|nr:unnamed protein product [Peniophora sp. CBMAI 1063]